MYLNDQEITVLKELARYAPDEGPTIAIERLLPSFQRHHWRLPDLMTAVRSLQRKHLVERPGASRVCISEQGIAALKSM